MSFENRYGWSDRLLHQLAFSSNALQVAVADIEERLFKTQLSAISVDRPVFITALPRAGTTILLNLLVETGLFASHTYRDMPFVLCPMIWQRLTKSFHINDEARERAHGDGLTVSADSPEAFEDIIWRHFWPVHYRPDCIEPWESCDDPEFLAFLGNHIKKIIGLRTNDENEAPRYVSKNNLNVARLACLPRALPGACIVVPFRDPLQQASSLLKQHLSFLETHRRDEFAKKYMEGVGHYDFGANLRPANFDGWLQRSGHLKATGLDFWLQYWIETYGNALSHAGDSIHLLSYDSLTSRPAVVLERLASVLHVAPHSRLTNQSTSLRSPPRYRIDTSTVDRRINDAAQDLYSELERTAAF